MSWLAKLHMRFGSYASRTKAAIELARKGDKQALKLLIHWTESDPFLEFEWAEREWAELARLFAEQMERQGIPILQRKLKILLGGALCREIIRSLCQFGPEALCGALSLSHAEEILKELTFMGSSSIQPLVARLPSLQGNLRIQALETLESLGWEMPPTEYAELAAKRRGKAALFKRVEVEKMMKGYKVTRYDELTEDSQKKASEVLKNSDADTVMALLDILESGIVLERSNLRNHGAAAVAYQMLTIILSTNCLMLRDSTLQRILNLPKNVVYRGIDPDNWDSYTEQTFHCEGLRKLADEELQRRIGSKGSQASNPCEELRNLREELPYMDSED